MSGQTRALLALFLGAIGIAFAPIFVRFSDVSATPTAFLRMATAMPFWLAALVWYRRTTPPEERPAVPWRWLLVAAFCFSMDLAAWHRSIHYTSVANATLLANFAPVFVTLGAWLWMGERITRTFLVGLVLALGGAAMLVKASFDFGGSHVKGDLLGLVTAFFYAGYILSVKRVRRTLATVALMTAVTGVSLVVLLGLSLAEGEAILPSTTKGWAAAVGLGVVPQFAGQGLIAYGLAHLPASFSSVSLLVQPATATLLAWWILGERIGAWQLVGGATILVGIILARRASAPGDGPPKSSS